MVGVVTSFGYNFASSQLRSGVAALAETENSQEVASTSGINGATFAELGSSRTSVLSLQPAITQVTAWSGNVASAQTSLAVTLGALGQISDMASTLGQTLSLLQGTTSPNAVASAAAQARDALNSLGNLLNIQDGDTYVFAGQDQTTAPVPGDPDLASSALASDIGSVIAGVGNARLPDVAGALQKTLLLSGTTAAGQPFSASLSDTPSAVSDKKNTVIIGADYNVAVGMVGTQGGLPSATSTGSPIRDLMRNLMVVSSLGNVTPGSTPFNTLIQGLQQTNNKAVSSLSDMTGQIGVTQNTLSTQSNALNQMSSMLTAQLGQARNVDLAQLSVQLTTTRNQLQASYSLIADMKGMTLANYL